MNNGKDEAAEENVDVDGMMMNEYKTAIGRDAHQLLLYSLFLRW